MEIQIPFHHQFFVVGNYDEIYFEDSIEFFFTDKGSIEIALVSFL